MYPIDRRKLAQHVYSMLSSLRKSAIILQVSHSTISRWIKQPERLKYKRNTVTKGSAIVGTIRDALANDPFLSTIKLSNMIKDVLKINVSKELVRTAIQTLGLSRKKARFFSRPKDLDHKTELFICARDKFSQEGRSFVSIDETSFGRNGKPIMGYAPVGKQLKIQRSAPRRTTTSSLVAASMDQIISRVELQGSFRSQTFSSFLESLPLPSGTVVLLDNVAFHHSKVAKDAAES